MKFISFIYNSNSRIIYNFCMYGSNLPRGRNFFAICIIRKNASKYAKLMVESYICDNLYQVYRFFSFWTKQFLKSFSQKIDKNLLKNYKGIMFKNAPNSGRVFLRSKLVDGRCQVQFPVTLVDLNFWKFSCFSPKFE